MYGLKNVRQRRNDALSRVDWQDLEKLLAVYYRGQGYRVDECGTGASQSRFDGGIDLKLYKDDQYIVVQCKHWNAKQVPHNPVHELIGVMSSQEATGAIFITSGEYTAYAREAAAGQGHVQLIDGDALREMIGPLPEPEQIPYGATGELSRGSTSRVTRAAETVGSRLLSAAEDRIRYGSRGRSQSTGARGLIVWLPLIKIGVAIVFFLVMTALINSALAPLTQPAATGSVPTLQPRQAPGQPSGTSAREPELVDWYTGTTIEEGPHLPPPRQPTPEEIRESQRKADEAMRILAPYTPEM